MGGAFPAKITPWDRRDLVQNWRLSPMRGVH
jgi:hypothetical protein